MNELPSFTNILKAFDAVSPVFKELLEAILEILQKFSIGMKGYED